MHILVRVGCDLNLVVDGDKSGLVDEGLQPLGRQCRVPRGVDICGIRDGENVRAVRVDT